MPTMPNVLRGLLLLCAVASTSACQDDLVRPEEVVVTRRQWVPLPELLTAPTPTPVWPERAGQGSDGARRYTNGQLLDMVDEYEGALLSCNADKAQIQHLQTRAMQRAQEAPE